MIPTSFDTRLAAEDGPDEELEVLTDKSPYMTVCSASEDGRGTSNSSSVKSISVSTTFPWDFGAGRATMIPSSYVQGVSFLPPAQVLHGIFPSHRFVPFEIKISQNIAAAHFFFPSGCRINRMIITR